MNLRGVRESGSAFAVPTYLFMAPSSGWRLWASSAPRWQPAPWPRAPTSPSPESGYGPGRLRDDLPVAASLLVGVCGAHRRRGDLERRARLPEAKSRNAATTLLLMGTIAVTMFSSMIVRPGSPCTSAEDPATQLLRDGPVGDAYIQHTVMGQVAQAVFDGFTPGVVLVPVVTGLILFPRGEHRLQRLSCPRLDSRQRRLPARQLHTCGNRLAFSNGIIIPAAAGRPDRPLQRRGHRSSSSTSSASSSPSPLSQPRHDPTLEPTARRREGPAARGRMGCSCIINGIGAAMSGTVLFRRARHQVHPWRRLRDRGDGGPLRAHARHSPPLRQGAGRAGGARGRHQGATVRRASMPSSWSPRSTSRPCAPWPMREQPDLRCSRR